MALTSVTQNPVLEVVVEAMGHVNYGSELGDNKGILKPLTLHSNSSKQGAEAHVLSDWQTYLLPMDEAYIQGLKGVVTNKNKAGLFFKLILTLKLEQVADTYINLRNWTKGVVWVNGHNLGRYWNIGPQYKLYCPAPWLTAGDNDIIIFDIHQLTAAPISLDGSLS
jgi:beta-galactosidase